MSRTVFCTKYQQELPGLDAPPYPGPTGSSLYLVSSGDSNLARLSIQAMRTQELLVTIALAESQGSLPR